MYQCLHKKLPHRAVPWMPPLKSDSLKKKKKKKENILPIDQVHQELVAGVE